MDPVTHAVTGVLIGHAAGETTNRRRAWWALAALAPDLDAVAGLAGREAYYEFHRATFHSLAGAAILAVASGAFLRRLGVSTWPRCTAIAATAIASHLLLDNLTSFGSALWLPFATAEIHWDLLFTVDAVVSTLLLAFVGLSWAGGARRRTMWARAGLVALAAYVGVAALARHAVGTTIRAEQGAGRLPAGTVSVLPQPPWAGSWAAFVSTDDAVWAGPVTLGRQGRPSLAEYRQPARDELLAAAMETPAARRFMAFARFPRVTRMATADGATFDFQDLRFSISGWDHSNRWYGVRVDVGRDASVRYAGFAHP
jgi:inner membrane protein